MTIPNILAPENSVVNNVKSNLSLISSNAAMQQYFTLLETLGGVIMNNLYADEFEFYVCSLELVNSSGKTVDFLVFPVNANSISEKESSDTDIQRTTGGIVTTDTSTFIPIDIRLNGNFGRRLRFLIGRDAIDATAINFTQSQNQKIPIFSNQLKTGYGTTKVLKNILQSSRKTDEKGNQYKLYFYNQGFGTSYLVKYIDSDFNQDMSSNMMWNYNVQLMGIAPINTYTKSPNSMNISDICKKKLLMQGINDTKNTIQSMLQ